MTTLAFLAACLPLIVGAIPTCRDGCKIWTWKTAERIAFSHRFRVDRGPREELQRFIDSMIERKRRGEKIHTSEAILDYQRSLLRGEYVEWTCAAGYKLFFVSAQGKFWICSMVRTNKHIMDVTLDDLYANYKKNPARKVAVFTAL